MTGTALLYQPRQKLRVGMAFAAALLIHFAAIAIANVHRMEKPGGPTVTEEFTPITFEEPPPTIPDPTPEHPEPLPTPTQNDQSFPEERPTPPPVRRQHNKPIAPIVKPRNNGSAAPLNWSSAKVLAVSAPRPEYPYEARRQRITGDGIVAMTIDPVTGTVRSVSMSKSTGSAFLDNAALDGFRRWRFKAGTVSAVTCPVTFTLNGASY
ncbi:MAG TPA: energy transducer TonB [Chthoniobacterales bacterium]|nr:energy transducer TonB [Chthoniobacterales bacterium]